MISEIIRLKENAGILESDATKENQREWYSYAIKEGLIETVVEDGRLLGFVEWVRGYLENNLFISIPKTIKTAPILFVTNCIARDARILWQLKTKLFLKNTDHKATCFYRKRNDKWVIIRRAQCVTGGNGLLKN